MYLDPFKLKELPFRLSPDPQFLYLSKQHARAKAYMESTIWFTDGFVVITGEIGSGKTTLIESFLKEIQSDVVIAQINQTQVSAVDFLQAVLVQFGFSPFKMKKAELIATLNNFLIEQYAAGRKVLLIVDEAQNLSMRVLEEIRLLSGVETTKEKVLRIILAGQPELNDKLDAPELAQLMQRVRLRFHLHTLSEVETRSYIQHRLDVAGAGDREIFAADTFAEVFRYCGGGPRLVNTLCDTAMMAAYTSDRSTVTRADIISAVRELQWVEYSARPQPRSEEHTSELQSQSNLVCRLLLEKTNTTASAACDPIIPFAQAWTCPSPPSAATTSAPSTAAVRANASASPGPPQTWSEWATPSESRSEPTCGMSFAVFPRPAVGFATTATVIATPSERRSWSRTSSGRARLSAGSPVRRRAPE